MNFFRNCFGRLSILLMCCSLFVGCTNEPKVDGNKKGSSTLQVLGRTDLHHAGINLDNTNKDFRLNMLSLLKVQAPQLHVEYTPFAELSSSTIENVKALEKLLDNEKLDLLWMNEEEFKKLSREGKLVQLDHLLSQDQVDLKQMFPPVVARIKQLGKGNIYGLTPIFEEQVLYYNTNLFDNYQIPYPKNGMTWEEVIRLAGRFPMKTDTYGHRVYGLSFSGYSLQYGFEWIRSIGAEQGLTIVNSEGTKVNLDSRQWQDVFKEVWSSYKNGTVDFPKAKKIFPFDERNLNIIEDSPFINQWTGKSLDMQTVAAMTIDSSQIIDALNYNLDDPKKYPKDYQVVSYPINPSKPEKTSGFYLPRIIGINAKSKNIQSAWEYVKLLNSKEFASLQRTNYPFALTTMNSQSRGYLDKNMDAFYNQNINNYEYIGYENMPETFKEKFDTLACEKLTLGLKQSNSAEEVLQSIQLEAQRQLDLEWAAKK